MFQGLEGESLIVSLEVLCIYYEFSRGYLMLKPAGVTGTSLFKIDDSSINESCSIAMSHR